MMCPRALSNYTKGNGLNSLIIILVEMSDCGTMTYCHQVLNLVSLDKMKNFFGVSFGVIKLKQQKMTFWTWNIVYFIFSSPTG